MLTLETLLNYHRQYYTERLEETAGLRFGQFVVNNLVDNFEINELRTRIFYERDTLKAFDMLLQLVEDK